MVLPNRIHRGEPPIPRGKTNDTEKHQRYIRNDHSAQKQTIGIPRASHKIVRELRELDEAVQSVGRLDDDSTGTRSMTGGESQRDKGLIDNSPDIQGRSNSSPASKRNHRKRGSSIEEAVKKAILHSAKNESRSRAVSHDALSPSIDFILSDLNRVVSAPLKSPARSVPLTPRQSETTRRRLKKEQTPTPLPPKNTKLAKDSSLPSKADSQKEIRSARQKKGDSVVDVDPFMSDVRFPLSSRSKDKTALGNSRNEEDWNPFDVNTFIASWPSEDKFTEPFSKSPTFVADFEHAFISSKSSI